VLFAGDAAHQVSPFGARGANSGLQDAENLAWRLDMILRGQAGPALMEGYNAERVMAADENILNSTRSTDFLTPKSEISRTFRDAVLTLAARHAFARPLVNSGRLSVPCVYDGLPGFGPDALPGAPARSRPGAPCPDTPLGNGFLLDRLRAGFMLLGIGTDVPERTRLAGVPLTGLRLPAEGVLAERLLGEAAQGVYLLRPDQHVMARWPSYDEGAVTAALHALTAEG
jgi:3-(3-hydroxy-phenyl)propionate hydroxylase